jgi:hypothetical protein
VLRARGGDRIGGRLPDLRRLPDLHRLPDLRRLREDACRQQAGGDDQGRQSHGRVCKVGRILPDRTADPRRRRCVVD